MKTYVTLVALASPFLLASGAQGKTSLHQALQAAYASSPALAAKRDEKAAVDALTIRGVSEFLPSLSLQGAKRLNTQKDHMPAPHGPTPTQAQEALSKSLNLSWDVFEGGGHFAQIKSYRAKMAAKQADLTATEQSVLLKGIKAYLDVWTREANLKVNEKAEKNYADTLALTQEKLKAGIASRSDVERARAEYERIKARLLSSQSDLKAAVAAYENATGLLFEGVTDPVMLIPAPATEEDVRAKALIKHPAIVSTNWDVVDADAQDTLAKTRFSPRVRLEGALTRHHVNRKDQESHRGLVPTAKVFDRSLTATLVIPLFQKGVEYAQVKESSRTLSQKKNMRRQLEQDILQAAQSYWSAWVSAKSQRKSYGEWVKAAVFLKDSVRQEHHFGLKTLFDVYQAERELLEAEYAFLEAQRSEFVYGYELLALTGQLNHKTLHLIDEETRRSPSSTLTKTQEKVSQDALKVTAFQDASLATSGSPRPL